MMLTQNGRFVYVVGDVDINAIHRVMSYTKKNAKFLPNPEWGVVRLYDAKNKRFPIGLLDKFPFQHYLTLASSWNMPPINTEGLRPYQVSAITAMRINAMGIVQMPTGSGKTKVAIRFIEAANVPTLVLVPTIDLQMQWKKEAPLGVHVMTYAGVRKKEYIQQFKLVIFDECHHVAAKTLYKIGMNLRQDCRVYGLSATPLMRDDDNLKVVAALGPVIFQITTDELVKGGYLCPAEVIFHNIYGDASDEMNYQEVYKEMVVNSKGRNNLVYRIASETQGKVLILVSLIEHGQILAEMLKDDDCVFLNGMLTRKERAQNDHRIIIATSIYDEGVDLPDLETLIIAAGGKSAIKMTQRVGRLLRNSPGKTKAIIHDFYDHSRWLCLHSKKRMKLMEENFPTSLI